jgi:biopolymer transport protein TolR
MAGGSFDSSGGPVAAINVTPLVDVMLVLLVIFMVAAPMLQQGVEVNLPKATNAPLKGSSEQVVVSLDARGGIFLGAGNPITVEEIGKKVALVLANRAPEDQKVFIKSDAKIEYGRVMAVMSALHQAGINQIGLVSSPAE